jgi:hypothetical protein
MGCVFKKAVTRPFPPGAEITVRVQKTTTTPADGSKAVEKVEVRVARWRDGKGQVRTAGVTLGKDGTDRVREESSTDFARHRDGNGFVVEAPTGCRDKTAAQRVLSDLERRAAPSTSTAPSTPCRPFPSIPARLPTAPEPPAPRLTPPRRCTAQR